MTRDEILAMPAGREMDALIAEKVMQLDHYEHKWEADGECEKCKCVTDFHSGRIYLNYEKIDYRDCINPDPYSTDISAAWEAVEGRQITLTHRGKFWFCDFGNQDDWDYSQADTAPLAICRAALLAVME